MDVNSTTFDSNCFQIHVCYQFFIEISSGRPFGLAEIEVTWLFTLFSEFLLIRLSKVSDGTLT